MENTDEFFNTGEKGNSTEEIKNEFFSTEEEEGNSSEKTKNKFYTKNIEQVNQYQGEGRQKSEFINNFYVKEGGKVLLDNKDQKQFDDPTEKYNADAISGIIPYQAIQNQVKLLKKQRVVIIHTDSPRLLSSAAADLIKGIDNKNEYDTRLLEFKRDDFQNSSLVPNLLLDPRVGGDKNQIFLIDLIDSHSAKVFLKVLLESIDRGKQLIEKLKDKNTYIICRFSSSELKEIFSSNNQSNGFIEWDLNFEDYLLPILTKLFSLTEAKELHKNILHQRKYGIYGDAVEFNQSISKLLDQRDIDIRRSVYGNIEKVNSLKEKGEKQIKRYTAEDLLSESPISKELLYVASFFPELHLREFRRIVLFLLEEKECIVEEEEAVITKKGKKKIIKKERKVNSREYFLENPDETFQKVHLEEILNEETKTVIDFNEPYLRKEVRLYFQSKFPNYCTEQFYDIVKFDLLFDVEASDKLVKNIIKLVVEMSLTDPQYYGTKLLLEIGVGKIKIDETESYEENALRVSSERDNDKESIIKALTILLQHRHNLDRLALLISELLEYESLKRTVDEFFGSLIQIWKKPEVLLSILKRLKYNNNIDQLFWLKRIFNEVAENKDEVKNEANGIFIGMGKKTNVEIFDFLDKVKEWWPKNTTDNEVKDHNLYGLAFLYNYSISTVYTLPDINYGKFPSNYFLFSSIIDVENEEVENKIDYLIEWLFHPSLNGFSYNNDYTFDLFDIRTNADLIEHWVLILLGNLSSKKANPKAKKIVKIILKKISQYTSKATRNNLKSVWSQKAQYYLVMGAELPLENRSKKNMLTYRRNNLRKILKYFDKY